MAMQWVSLAAYDVRTTFMLTTGASGKLPKTTVLGPAGIKRCFDSVSDVFHVANARDLAKRAVVRQGW